MVSVSVRLIVGLDLGFGLGLVEIQTPLIQYVVDLLWICCRRFSLMWICLQLVQQIHNKLYKWRLETGLNALADVDTASRCVLPRPC